MRIAAQVFVLFALSAVFSAARASSVSKKQQEHRRYAASSCSAVKPLFTAKSVSDPPDHSIEEPVLSRLCPKVNGSSTCCTSRMEHQLKALAKKELQQALKKKSNAIQAVLTYTSHQYLDKIILLSRRSENHTLEAFSQGFQRLAPESRAHIQQLFAEVRRVLANPGPTSFLNDSSADLEEASLHDTITNFFHQLFPLVYRHSVIHTNVDITNEYSICLQNSIEKLRPFGEIPKSMGFSVARAVRSIHDFLRALNLGTEALEVAESAWEKTDECSTALLRMNFCSWCLGYTETKPCAGYCHNVLRGCLAPLTELDASWNGYVDSLDEHAASSYAPNSLVKAEKAIVALETQIADAVMQAMVDGPSLEKRVKSACGPVQLQESGGKHHQHKPPHSPAPSIASAKKDTKYELETQLSNLARQVLGSLIHSKGFFSALSDSICAQDNFAETEAEADCWNGIKIAPYTKTVVSVGLGAQKYNPELPWNGKPTDLRIIQMSDRLRQVRRALLGQMSALPEADNQMLEDGSGSGGIEPRPGGGGPDDEDNWNGGSGSGEGTDRDAQEHPRMRTPNSKQHSPSQSGGGGGGGAATTTGGSALVSAASWAISLSLATLLVLAQH